MVLVAAGCVGAALLIVGMMAIAKRNAAVETRVAPASTASPAAAGATTAVDPNSLKVEPLQVKIIARPAWQARRDKLTAFAREFEAGIRPYLEHDYATAATRMQELAAKFPTTPEPLVYGGISELMLGHADTAADLLTRAQPLTREVFAEDIVWYLALAHRAMGKPSVMMELRTLCAIGADHGPLACAAVREVDAREARQRTQ
jgi:hypothetical protein